MQVQRKKKNKRTNRNRREGNRECSSKPTVAINELKK